MPKLNKQDRKIVVYNHTSKDDVNGTLIEDNPKLRKTKLKLHQMMTKQEILDILNKNANRLKK